MSPLLTEGEPTPKILKGLGYPSGPRSNAPESLRKERKRRSRNPREERANARFEVGKGKENNTPGGIDPEQNQPRGKRRQGKIQHRKSRTDIRKFPLFLDGVVSVVESERRIPG